MTLLSWETVLSEHRAVLDHIEQSLCASCDALADAMTACLKRGGKILVAGNGGSAGDAQHFAAELVNRFLITRRPYASIALTTDSSVLTSIGNDFGFEQAFEKQVQALGRPEDFLLVISTSGNSENLVRAVNAAKEIGLPTAALLGGEGGQLALRVDYPLTIACTRHTPRIQEGHLVLMHALCERIEAGMEE